MVNRNAVEAIKIPDSSDRMAYYDYRGGQATIGPTGRPNRLNHLQNRVGAYRGNGSPVTGSSTGEAYHMHLQDHLIEDYSQRVGGG